MKRCLIISGAEKLANMLIPKLNSSKWECSSLYHADYPLQAKPSISIPYSSTAAFQPLTSTYDCMVCCADYKEEGSIKDMNFPEKNLKSYSLNLLPAKIAHKYWNMYASQNAHAFIKGDYDTFVNVRSKFGLYTHNKMMAYKLFQQCKSKTSYFLSGTDIPDEALADVIEGWMNSAHRPAHNQFISIKWINDSAVYDYVTNK